MDKKLHLLMHPSRTSMSCWPGFDQVEGVLLDAREPAAAQNRQDSAPPRRYPCRSCRRPWASPARSVITARRRVRSQVSMPTTSPRSARPSVRMANRARGAATPARARGVAFVDAVARARRNGDRGGGRKRGRRRGIGGELGPRPERAFSFSDHARVPRTVDGVAKYEGVDGGHPILCSAESQSTGFPQCIGHRGRARAVLRLVSGETRGQNVLVAIKDGSNNLL